MTTADRPFLGILLMLGFCLLAPVADALAKHLALLVPLLTLVFARFAIQPLILYPLALGAGQDLRLSRRATRLTVARTVLHMTGISLMYLSLRYLPLADAIAIAFVMPFILLLLGHLVLGEEVGPQRIAACAVGFVGTLMVIQPNFAEVGAPALLPLGVAVVFALFMLVTRQIAKEVDALVLQAHSGLIATGLIALVLLFGLPGDDLQLELPDGRNLWLLILMALIGTFGHPLMTWSLRFAPSVTLAPMQYLEIPVATLVGLMAFGDLPNGLAALGICVTIGAGLYVVMRERAIARRLAAPPAA